MDLIYLDAPFDSKRDDDLLFKSPKGVTSEGQIEAFENTWDRKEQEEREFDGGGEPENGVADLILVEVTSRT